MRPKAMWGSRFIRRRVLSLGSPICCPSATYYRPNLMKQVFLNGFRADEDWEAWERLSKLKGDFIFCNKILTYHRIHEDSETTKILMIIRDLKKITLCIRSSGPNVLLKCLLRHTARVKNLII